MTCDIIKGLKDILCYFEIVGLVNILMLYIFITHYINQCIPRLVKESFKTLRYNLPNTEGLSLHRVTAEG